MRISQERNDLKAKLIKCEDKLEVFKTSRRNRHKKGIFSKNTGLLGKKYEVEIDARKPKIIGELPQFDKSRLRSHRVKIRGKSLNSK